MEDSDKKEASKEPDEEISAAEEETCNCGHHHEDEGEHERHEHHHHHDEEDEDECGCGHEHHHHHHHDDDDEDEDECGCGHEHHHHHHHDDDDEDEDECGCGHEHHHHHHHDEDDEDECGCGHEHHHHHHHDEDDEDECGCGHEHHHHHHDEDDEDECGCGHEHHHHHDDNEDECGCGHEHHHHHEHEHTHASGPRRIYILENLDCANCAAKMERRINELPGVEEATITYATKQLRLVADDPEKLLPQIREICQSIDDEVEVVPKPTPATGTLQTRIFIVENLDCANCAAKMERKINELPGIEEATLTFATKQLRVTADNPERYLPEMQRLCASVDDEVRVVPKVSASSGARTKIYIVENLDCANCAAKMERKINELPGIEEATLTFATKQLRVTAENPERYLPEIQEICASVDDAVEVREKEEAPGISAEKKNAADRAAEEKAQQKKDLRAIIAGAVLFIAGVILERLGVPLVITALIQVAAYLILGLQVVLKAVRNITKGNVFDENFLMSIATLGAFAIQNFEEAVGVMLFYRIGEYFEERAVAKSRGQIMDAVDLRPEVVNLKLGDSIQTLPAEEARPGDVLLVRPGDRIPLDGVILEGESRIDTSPITGEPVPVGVHPGDPVTSGCVNTSGQLVMRVEKPLSESMVTRILDSVENAAASKPKIDRFITRFARIYTPVVVLLALATAILPSLVTGNWYYWVYTALSFLVMSCPCALVLSVPLAFFSGIGAGSKKGILFKGGVSLESMKNVKTVVMDKTGTITEGNFVLQETVSVGEIESDRLLSLCASCEENSTHPIAVSIVTAAQEKGLPMHRPEELEEIAGHGIRARLDGHTVLCGNRKLMDKYGVTVTEIQPRMFGAEVLAAVDGVFAGYLIISDTVKSDAKSAIARLKAQGITTAMLTGDAADSAEAVARETGVDEVHARLLPEEKLTELQKIREQHGAVMFVGDGINDAPVLAGADVGAAMGSGADAAIEAADVVFMTSSMEAIPQSIAIARATGRIAMQNVVFALTVKIIVMILGLAGHASMWAAVFADTGVAMICILNSIRILYSKK